MTTPTTPEPRFFVHHDEVRRQWQIIDRERRTSPRSWDAVIGELDDRYPTSKGAIERYCRQLNEGEGQGT